jgi:hypothetical protein
MNCQKNTLYKELIFIHQWDWSGTKSTVTTAIYWSILPALDERL